MQDLAEIVPLGVEAAFPKAEFDSRVAAVQDILKEKDLELYVTMSPENTFYLTGHQTQGYYPYQVLCVPAEGAPFLFMRDLERFNARANCYLEDLPGYYPWTLTGKPMAEKFVGVMKERGWVGKRIGVDRNAWYMTANIYEVMKDALGELLDASFLVEPLRWVKSPAELDCIRQAAKANDAGMLAGLAATRAGGTENEIAAAVMHAAVLAGSEYMAMEPYVTSGWRSGLPHSTWRRRRIEYGDMSVIESSASYNRYTAALFRSVAVGDVPAAAVTHYEACQDVLESMLGHLRAGVSGADLDREHHKIIERHGMSAGSRKPLGYSLGIAFPPDWGEAEILRLDSILDVELQAGMVFHVPICFRDYAKYTCAVSESVIITEDGCAILSEVPRDLVRV